MDLISEINAKYSALEAEVDRKLEKAKQEEAKLEKLCAKDAEKSIKNHPPKVLSYEEALARNTNLLKSLDMAKARLRSRSTFSPMEHILEKAILNYKRDLQGTEADRNAIQTEQPIHDSNRQTEFDHIYSAVEHNDEHNRQQQQQLTHTDIFN